MVAGRACKSKTGFASQPGIHHHPRTFTPGGITYTLPEEILPETLRQERHECDCLQLLPTSDFPKIYRPAGCRDYLLPYASQQTDPFLWRENSRCVDV